MLAISRNLIVWLIAFNYLLIAVGMPIAIPADDVAVVKKDRGVPFPCMDRACGCMNAEQCRKSCCCMTKKAKTSPVRSCCQKAKCDGQKSLTWALSVSAAKCRGLSTLVLTGVLATFTTDADLTPFSFPNVATLPLQDEVSIKLAFEVHDPPPNG